MSHLYLLCGKVKVLPNPDPYTTAMIKVGYSLNLPEGVNVGDKPTSKTHQFKIDTPVSSDTKKSYYGGLRYALEEARSQVGDELTVWKNCVGEKELGKELKKGNGDDEGELELEEGDSV